MSNIYIRVPQYVAAFYRNRDENHPKGLFDPIEFDELSFEARLLKQGLRPDRSRGQVTVLCYSQQSWNNILQGKLPYGGKSVLNRDPNTWPTAKEICALEGRAMKLHEELFDYLCIALPREALIGGQIVRITRAFSLDAKTAQQMSNFLRNEFYHFFMEWVIQEQRIFRQRRINITKAEMMERFFAQYDIPIKPSARERNTMRMLARRLFKRAANAQTNNRTPITGDYFDYIGDDMEKAKEE